MARSPSSRHGRVLQCFDCRVWCVAVSPGEGLYLAVGLQGGAISLHSAHQGTTAAVMQLTGHTRSVTSVAFAVAPASSPATARAAHEQRRLLLASSSLDRAVRLWDVERGECVGVLQDGHTAPVMVVRFLPHGDDGWLLASAADDCTVRLWHAADCSAGPVLQGHAGFVRGLAVSADGALLASGSWDETVRLWHMPTGAPGLVLREFKNWINCMAFSPILGSTLLAVGCNLKLVCLWDVTSGQLVRKLEGHMNEVYSLAFSPDGALLATGAVDQTVHLWSVADGALRETFSGHTSQVSSVAFAPDGRQIVSGSHDGTVRYWTVCGWSDRNHKFFGAEFKFKVFRLMCVRQRLEGCENLPQLPIEMWLEIFAWLQLME